MHSLRASNRRATILQLCAQPPQQMRAEPPSMCADDHASMEVHTSIEVKHIYGGLVCMNVVHTCMELNRASVLPVTSNELP